MSIPLLVIPKSLGVLGLNTKELEILEGKLAIEKAYR